MLDFLLTKVKKKAGWRALLGRENFAIKFYISGQSQTAKSLFARIVKNRAARDRLIARPLALAVNFFARVKEAWANVRSTGFAEKAI